MKTRSKKSSDLFLSFSHYFSVYSCHCASLDSPSGKASPQTRLPASFKLKANLGLRNTIRRKDTLVLKLMKRSNLK